MVEIHFPVVTRFGSEEVVIDCFFKIVPHLYKRINEEVGKLRSEGIILEAILE
jgi:hypothetical protein